MLGFITPDDFKKIDRQIRAIKAVLPKDNPKDRVIHEMALTKLSKQRDKLLNK